MPARDPRPLAERFMDKVSPEPNSGCWLWTGFYQEFGYGRMGVGYAVEGTRGTAMAHRLSYEIFVGPIPDGICVLHRCDVPECVNPEHLWLGTHSDNVNDKVAKGRHHYSKRTHCKNGHEFSGSNVRTPPGTSGRVCRSCQKAGRLRFEKRNRK